jgi:Bacterial Ig-like domain (group 3)/MBG domain (YGX type)
VAGYGIQTSPTVDLAASEGVQIAHPFATLSRLEAIDPAALTEMRNQHMHMVSTDLLQDVDDWACWHEWTFVGPGSDYCSGVPPAYSGFGSDATDQQGADNTLVSAITSDLNTVNNSGNADLVSYFTVLDTWPARDPGSGQQILPEVNSLIHSITPGKQSICSFPFAYLVPLKNFEPYAGWLDVNHQGGPIQNFSPSGCDNVAVYGYAQRSPSNPTVFTASDYDWTMSKVLQPWVSALIQAGAAADPGWNRQVNLIGVGQAFGQDTTASGNYFLVPLLDSTTAHRLGVPVYQPIIDQETAFCRAGMSIMPFAWELSSSQYPYVQTPSNNADIEAGIQAAVAECHTIWQGTTTTTVSSSSPESQSTYGDSVTLSASVTASTAMPTGSVAFLDGQALIGTAALSNDEAAITTSVLSAGTHPISGVYTPNQGGDFVTSTSAAITQAVGPAPLTITASSIAAPYGAAMPAILPSYAGLQNGDSAPAVSPTCATTAAPGSDTGAYRTNCTGASDPNYTIVYEPGSITIVPAGTTTAINSSSLDNSSIYGDPVILSATVSASFGTPNGSITFRAGRSQLQSVSLAGGAASYTTTALKAGRRRILAVYDPSSNAEGNNNYAPSSISFRFRVQPAPTVADLAGGALVATVDVADLRILVANASNVSVVDITG